LDARLCRSRKPELNLEYESCSIVAHFMKCCTPIHVSIQVLVYYFFNHKLIKFHSKISVSAVGAAAYGDAAAAAVARRTGGGQGHARCPEGGL
jgi:hypothetical protein